MSTKKFEFVRNKDSRGSEENLYYWIFGFTFSSRSEYGNHMWMPVVCDRRNNPYMTYNFRNHLKITGK